jgi:hypothetical protein
MKQALLSPMHAYRPLPQWGVWLLAGMLMLLAPVAGLLAVTGSILLVTIPVLLLVSLVLAFHPWLFTWLIIFSGLVVMGILRLYAPEFQIIRWIIPLVALAVPIAIFLLQAFQPHPAERSKLPALFWWGMAFTVAALFSSLVNWSGFSDAAFGAKNYFQVWGLVVAFALIRYHGDFVRGLRILFLSIAVLQLPFVLHQWLVLVPQRSALGAISANDVIAGTFGADLFGGGNNAILSAYLTMAIGLLISSWKEHVISVWWMILGVLLLVSPVFVNESKIAFFYFWLMFLVLYWPDIVKRPAHFLVGNILLFAFLFLLLIVYATVAAVGGHRIQGVFDYLSFVQQQNMELGYGTYTLNRWTALTFWFSQHMPHDILHAFIGHGLGQSQEGGIVLTSDHTLGSGRYHGMGIGQTTLAALLWDVGLIGLAVVSMLFVSAFRLAGRLARDCQGQAPAVALFKSLQVAVAILFLSLTHKSFFIFEPTFQILFVLIIGYLIYSARHLLHPDRQAPRAAGG